MRSSVLKFSHHSREETGDCTRWCFQGGGRMGYLTIVNFPLWGVLFSHLLADCLKFLFPLILAKSYLIVTLRLCNIPSQAQDFILYTKFTWCALNCRIKIYQSMKPSHLNVLNGLFLDSHLYQSISIFFRDLEISILNSMSNWGKNNGICSMVFSTKDQRVIGIIYIPTMCSWRKLVFFCSQMKLLQIRPGI
jgi:hypothetical protein